MLDMAHYWKACLAKDEKAMETYLHDKAMIYWPNTNECFTKQAFIQMNTAYPGQYEGELLRLEEQADGYITVLRVWSKEASFHVCAFIKVEEKHIMSIHEYWGEDQEAPAWRQSMQLSQKITELEAKRTYVQALIQEGRESLARKAKNNKDNKREKA